MTLIAILALAAPAHVLAQRARSDDITGNNQKSTQNTNEFVAEVKGTGATADEARNDAIRKAMQLAIESGIYAQRTVQDGTLVADISASQVNADVQGVRVLRAVQDDLGVSIIAEVTIRLPQSSKTSSTNAATSGRNTSTRAVNSERAVSVTGRGHTFAEAKSDAFFKGLQSVSGSRQGVNRVIDRDQILSTRTSGTTEGVVRVRGSHSYKVVGDSVVYEAELIVTQRSSGPPARGEYSCERTNSSAGICPPGVPADMCSAAAYRDADYRLTPASDPEPQVDCTPVMPTLATLGEVCRSGGVTVGGRLLDAPTLTMPPLTMHPKVVNEIREDATEKTLRARLKINEDGQVEDVRFHVRADEMIIHSLVPDNWVEDFSREHGYPYSALFLSAGDRLKIDKAVIEPLEQWRFTPAVCGSQPTPILVGVKIDILTGEVTVEP